MVDIQMMPMFITIYGGAGLACAALAYVIAASKHRNAEHWATFALLVPPAVLLTLFLSKLPPDERQARRLERRLRKYVEHD